MQELFHKFGDGLLKITGSALFFLLIIVLISVTGIYFDFSPEWKNNVGFIIAVTVFPALILVQKSRSNRNRSIQLKLDELIEAAKNGKKRRI